MADPALAMGMLGGDDLSLKCCHLARDCTVLTSGVHNCDNDQGGEEEDQPEHPAEPVNARSVATDGRLGTFPLPLGASVHVPLRYS